MAVISAERKPVNTSLLNKWKRSYRIGDIVQIAKKSDLSIATISVAFKGAASEKTVTLINEYYRQSGAGKKIQNVTPLRIGGRNGK